MIFPTLTQGTKSLHCWCTWFFVWMQRHGVGIWRLSEPGVSSGFQWFPEPNPISSGPWTLLWSSKRLGIALGLFWWILHLGAHELQMPWSAEEPSVSRQGNIYTAHFKVLPDQTFCRGSSHSQWLWCFEHCWQQQSLSYIESPTVCVRKNLRTSEPSSGPLICSWASMANGALHHIVKTLLSWWPSLFPHIKMFWFSSTVNSHIHFSICVAFTRSSHNALNISLRGCD